ncbi:galactose mutarotase [Photobacterium jeanii]|uniref:Aldose 1-epimerase n=1 Tax=Photobacterium jeanii TaxID=858640 RepID=A0A178KLU4_9GAMM|nr:galactose-1-epimerase [Photobacterium jeanii]OAN18221.1 galactose mutarotase [Photobacterium jeanii]PST92102.1 galactose-1-epimerase [Photobacterium jeanii]
MDTNLFETMTSQAAYDGLPAKLITLTNRSGMQIMLMDIGASWLSCRLPLACGEQREVLLGMGTLEDFMRQTSYMGVTVGRYANRIANGTFSIDGKEFQVSTNQAGNCLHGGEFGFDQRRWQIELQSSQHVVFSLVSPDGDQGFPGELVAQVTYHLTDENQVEITYRANSSKATPCNLTNHAYFNLAGAESGLDCLSHHVQISASQYLPTDEFGIPYGEFAEASGTAFDFREGKTLASDWLSDVNTELNLAKGFDHSFTFEHGRDVTKPVATVISPDEQVKLTVTTDKPAMQLYTGNWLAGTPSRTDTPYKDYAGFALETQLLPDAPNHLEWRQPDPILRPNQTYQYRTCYQFMV